MTYYPHTYPLILNDTVFVDYGGQTGTSTANQRTAAYLIAEKAATKDIGSFLLPTTVTGTYHPTPGRPLYLEHGYVTKVISTRLYDGENTEYQYISGTNTGYINTRDAEYGIVDYGLCFSHCGAYAFPYQMQIVYEAGLATGSANQADVLLALTTVAQLTLNEMIGYGNEGSGDVGIKSFKNQQYSEERFGLVNTALGSSPKANFAHKLLTGLRKHRYGALRGI